MNKIKIESPRDVLLFLKRRMLWIIIPFVSVSFLVVVISMRLPDLYMADVFMIVEPQKIPEAYIKSPLSVDTVERLNALSQELLTWTNLFYVIKEFRPYESKFVKLNDEEQVKMLKRNIGLNIQPGRIPYFWLSFQHRNPAMAKQITDRLATMFVDFENKLREYRIKGTAEFLDGELEDLEKDLRTPESKLIKFRQENYDQVPELLEANLKSLEILHQQLRANTEALDRSEVQRRSIEQQLAKTSPTVDGLVAGPDQDSYAAYILKELAAKRSQYRNARSKYTENHPDVLAAKKSIEKIEKELNSEYAKQGDGNVQKTLVNNPTYKYLAEQSELVKNEINSRRQDRKRIEQDIVVYTARINNTPRADMERSNILKGYDSMKQLYNVLLAKKQEARLANDLELRQKGEQFRVKDTAYMPVNPTGPDRIKYMIIGILLSLALGLGLALGTELIEERILNENEVAESLNLPVLVEIPEIVTASDIRMKRIKTSAILLLSAAFASGYALLLILLGFDNRFSRTIFDFISMKILFY